MKKIGFLLVLLTIINLNSIEVRAESKDRGEIKNKIENQSDELYEEYNDFEIESIFTDENQLDNYIEQQKENVKNSTGEFSTKDLVNTFRNWFYKFLIGTRTTIIIGFIAIASLLGVYAATFGSRNLELRRKIYLIIRNSSVLFIIYINAPLFILLLKADKQYLLKIDYLSIALSSIDFLRENSIFICVLVFFSGFIKHVLSKNDIGLLKSGKYQMKFSGWLLIILNLIMPLIKFLL